MVDVLKPELLHLGNFCYRVNPGDANSSDSQSNIQSQDDLEQLDYQESESTQELDDRIKETNNGGYTAALTIPSSLFKFLIGRGGEMKRRLEFETKCQIIIPERGREGSVVVKGRLARQVSSAITRIEVLTESGRSKLAFTHFLSIPIHHETIQETFTMFKEQIIEDFSQERGVDDTIFQKSSKLHLTLGTMTLLNDSEVSQATDTLHNCKTEIARLLGEDCLLTVRGLDYMNDDPSSVDVLYAKVTPENEARSASNSLQEAVDYLTRSFSEAGLLNNDYDRSRVKLHVTLMNTLFRKDRTGTDKPRSKVQKGNRETFDAQKILKTMNDFSFGEIEFPGIHLSQRHSTACDGYYQSATTVLSPGTTATATPQNIPPS